MKRYAVLFVLAMGLLSSNTGNAQEYGSAIGLRLGSPISASFKAFISESSAIEGYVGFRGFSGYSWINIGALYQIHKPIEGVDGLQWYFGGGVGAYIWSYDSVFVGDSSSSFNLGISGNLGLDYKFANSPINLSVDWVPTFFLAGFSQGFGAGYGAFSVRYVLNE